MIAQKVGAGERQTAKKAMINVFYLMLGCSVGIMIIAITCSQSLFALIHISEALLPGATTYATIIFMGTIFTACYHYESAILRAYGNSLAPLLFLILSAILNIVLDLVFVIVFHLGIAGVALSTVTAQLICCGACFIYLVKQGLLKFERQDYQLDIHCIKEHIQVGMPMAFFQALLSISFLFVQSALNTLGSAEVAAYTIAYKMDSMMLQILSGFGTAISTFTAQNYGHRAYARIREGARDTL